MPTNEGKNKGKPYDGETFVLEEIRSMIELFGTFPASRINRSRGVICMDSGSNAAYESYALAMPGALDDPAAAVRDALAFFADGEGGLIPHIWTLFPGVPDAVEHILEENGIVLVDDFIGMTADTSSSSAVRKANDARGRGGDIVTVSPGEAEEWAQATWRGFDSDDDASEGFLNFTRDAMKRPDALTLYAVREKNSRAMAATGMLCTAGDTAGIYYVATPPAFRRRGFAAIVMEALMSGAMERGFEEVSLLATPPGVPLYETCGFRTVCPVRIRQCGE